MLPLAVCQVTGFSKKLTYQYIELYKLYATEDYIIGPGKDPPPCPGPN